MTVSRVTIEGFKSIAEADLYLRRLNIVIGANGSGKSNLIGVFRILDAILADRLPEYVAGEPDRFLHHGRKTTPEMSVCFQFQASGHVRLNLRAHNDVLLLDGNFGTSVPLGWRPTVRRLRGSPEAQFVKRLPAHLRSQIRDYTAYHFHDTSDSSPVKRLVDMDDNRSLRRDASNLPAYLYLLKQKHPVQFRHIEEHVRLVAPFFDGFVLAPSKLNERKIKLEWRHKGSDAYFDAYSLSDGTLRFICLATLLLQPSPPSLILLDEPELGLHPFAIRILAEMLESVSRPRRSQVLLATQSVTLLNQFSIDDASTNIIIAENDGLATKFRSLEYEKLKDWLDEFSLGELWEKNVIGGRP